jgi:hypothetical protein
MASAEPPPPPKPAAGWYPDPGGTGVQRYFDGTNWGQFAPPLRPPPLQRPPKKGLSGKTILAIGALIFLLIIIGKACASDDKKDSGSTSPSSATGVAAPPTSTKPPLSEHEIEEGVIDTCQKAIKKNLKDPDSAKFGDWKAWPITHPGDKPPKVTYHPEDGDKLYNAAGSVNARNGFGGYVGDQEYGCDASVTTSYYVDAMPYSLEDLLNPTTTPGE